MSEYLIESIKELAPVRGCEVIQISPRCIEIKVSVPWAVWLFKAKHSHFYNDLKWAIHRAKLAEIITHGKYNLGQVDYTSYSAQHFEPRSEAIWATLKPIFLNRKQA